MQDAIAPDNKLASEFVLLARLVRPQGRHGEILADILTDFPERFAERKRLFLLRSGKAPREIDLQRHWLHKGRVVLKFAGVDSITEAEQLRGLEVAIPTAERAALEDDAVYIDDLVGCRVFDTHGLKPDSAAAREVGEIIDVDRESTAHPMLVVRDAQSQEVLIPFVKPFLVRIDVAAKRLEMDLPEGLIELNAPLTTEQRIAEERERQLAGQQGSE